jgi:hypothetical protein
MTAARVGKKTQNQVSDRLATYVNVCAQPFSCQELMPDPFDLDKERFLY